MRMVCNIMRTVFHSGVVQCRTWVQTDIFRATTDYCILRSLIFETARLLRSPSRPRLWIPTASDKRPPPPPPPKKEKKKEFCFRAFPNCPQALECPSYHNQSGKQIPLQHSADVWKPTCILNDLLVVHRASLLFLYINYYGFKRKHLLQCTGHSS